MRVTDKERRKYLKSISALLVCSSKTKKQFMADFSSNIDDFLQNNPDASLADLENAMGSPQEIAEGFIANVSPKEIKKHISLVRLLVVFLTAALVIYGIVLFFLWFDAHIMHDYYDVVTVTENYEYGTDNNVNNAVVYHNKTNEGE